MPIPINFKGTVPQRYDEYLAAFLFDHFATDIAQRVHASEKSIILELACGTGCATRPLLQKLPATAHLTATDLEEEMLKLAMKNIQASNIDWALQDMTHLSYDADLFDGIVCQFGIMLVPEKLKALREMHRVLKKGGQLLFNVWGNIQSNAVWDISGKVIESFMGVNPILLDPGPFSMDEALTRSLLQQAGFTDIKTTVVNQTGSIATAADAAKGFIEGLPVFIAISQKNPAMLPQLLETLEKELAAQLGNQPLLSPLQALVFEARK